MREDKMISEFDMRRRENGDYCISIETRQSQSKFLHIQTSE
jgi:hypothetical protein